MRKGELSEGAQVFEGSIASAPVEEQARLRELLAWARGLEAEGVVRLERFRRIANRWVLLLRLAAEDVGFAAVWHDSRAKLQLQRSVFERYAPAFVAPLEVASGGAASRGGYFRWDGEVLRLVAEAYRRAAGRG